MKITDSMYLVPHVRGANSYLFLGKEASRLVDTGLGGNAGKILEFVKSLGREASSIAYIALTHSDIDHISSVVRLEQLTEAKVAIHKADAPHLSGEMKLNRMKGALGALFTIMSPFARFKPVKPDILLEDSDTITGLTVVHTPGHTAGSVSFHLPEEALLAGDALRTNKKRLPMLRGSVMTENMDQAKRIDQEDFGG
jgi:glyoxylase-like metal-dependent hydrolase (beta-lactamase superfamily II)